MTKSYNKFVDDLVESKKGDEHVNDHAKFTARAKKLAAKMHKDHPTLEIKHQQGDDAYGPFHDVVSHTTGEVFAHYDHKKKIGTFMHDSIKKPIYPTNKK